VSPTVTARICFGLLLSVLTVFRQPSAPRPIFQTDLRPYGYDAKGLGPTAVRFTELNFLSDDLVLVTVSHGLWGSVEEQLLDRRPSTFQLFEVAQNRLVKRAEIPVVKFPGSVRAIQDGRFVILSKSGLQLCSRELECGTSRSTGEHLLISPSGARIVVDMQGAREQMLLDGTTLRELARYPRKKTSIVPCDGAILAIEDPKVYLQIPGQADRQLPFEDKSYDPKVRCINQSAVVGFESVKVLAVANMAGDILFRMPVQEWWKGPEVVTSASGTRFGLYQKGYTAWNSFVNFLDIDEGRPANFESVSVMSSDSGKQLLALRWDPRPYRTASAVPALSPDGHKLAVIRHGNLEIFEIP
jgi:hypothetical protein